MRGSDVAAIGASARRRTSAWRGWRRDYFATWWSLLLSLSSLLILALVAWKLLDWGVLHATFDPAARQAECRAAGGACWSVIANRWRLIFFGLYPYEEHWRSSLACIVILATIVLSCLPRLWTAGRLSTIWLAGYAAFIVLMRGGVFGLPLVQESQWGGLSLTLFAFVSTVIVGMPTAIVLALLRNSELPLVSRLTGIMIDTVRSLPLVSILFTFAIVLPFMLPDILVGEKLYRALLGASLFFAAYQAEIIRGGMQGVARGQDEAAKALGISYSHRISRILLPQAFRNALPATINQLVITLMETSLLVIIGFFELIASANAAFGNGEWQFAFVEVYVFVAAIYFVLVFGLSRYGVYLERRMAAGQR